MPFILVGLPSTNHVRNKAMWCLSELNRQGLQIGRISLDRNQALIDTPKCRIIFRSASNMDKLRGLKCDASFGLSEEDQALVNRSHKPTEFKGTFLDYIYKVEGIEEV